MSANGVLSRVSELAGERKKSSPCVNEPCTPMADNNTLSHDSTCIDIEHLELYVCGWVCGCVLNSKLSLVVLTVKRLLHAIGCHVDCRESAILQHTQNVGEQVLCGTFIRYIYCRLHNYTII